MQKNNASFSAFSLGFLMSFSTWALIFVLKFWRACSSLLTGSLSPNAPRVFSGSQASTLCTTDREINSVGIGWLVALTRTTSFHDSHIGSYP